MAEDQQEQKLSPDEQIIQEARDRFQACEEWESDFWKLFIDDVKFANGDADNGYQWPDSIRKNREIDDRPCLTINKTKQHCLQVINDGRQHAPQIKVHPIDSGATAEAAKLLDGLVRHVEYRSNAQAAYNTAQEFAVFGGIGYWRVVTDYANDDTFDQEIFIQRVKDPKTVRLDPDIKEIDGSDAMFGFVFVDFDKKEFRRKYGKKASEEADFPLGKGDTWLAKNHIRVAEYFRKVPKTEKIAALPDSVMQGLPGLKSNIIKQSDVPDDLWKVLSDHPDVKMRDVEKWNVEWFLIAGNKIKDRRPWPGKYIPIVRCVGEEVIIDGQLERKGHVRSLKDPQRMYNYWSSSATEHVALQTKIPYVAPARAIEGYEGYWKNANNENTSYLPFNDIDEQGRPIERPQREQAPVMAEAYVKGMQITAGEMMMVSGQYQAVMGQPSNETSGVAINARQRQGDNATYHFIDHQALAVRYTGRIIVDLFPKVYDTPRVMRILGEDGVEDFIHLDPNAKQAVEQRKEAMTNEVRQILNPSIGNYDVVVDVGPAYATRRQEAFAAMSQIMAQNQDLMSKAGDLLFKAADFPHAEDIAERLSRAIPPALKGEGPDPQLQQAQQQMQQMQKAMQGMADMIEKLKNERGSNMIKANADVYRAETERAQMIHDASMDQQKLVHDIALAVTQMMQTQQGSALSGAPLASQAAGPQNQPEAPPQAA